MTTATTNHETTIAYRPEYRAIAGSAAAAVFLAQAIYWTKNKAAKARDGWFFKTADQWTTETGLTRTEQETARKNLIASGLLSTTRKHTEVPGAKYCRGRVWFRLNIDKLAAELEQVGSSVAAKLRALSAPVAKTVKAGFYKAVAMAQKFTGQNDARPMATRVEVKAPTFQYTADDFAECNPFIKGFAVHVDNIGDDAKRGELVRLFRRFGFNSNYVKTCFARYIRAWVKWFNKAAATLAPEERDEFKRDFAGVTEAALDFACSIQPATINA